MTSGGPVFFAGCSPLHSLGCGAGVAPGRSRAFAFCSGLPQAGRRLDAGPHSAAATGRLARRPPTKAMAMVARMKKTEAAKTSSGWPWSIRKP